MVCFKNINFPLTRHVAWILIVLRLHLTTFYTLSLSSQVEVKPYVLDDQLCDECQGTRCGGKFAPFFCANVTCLQYYCEYCWAAIHSRAGREFHKPLVKEGGDRPRHISFRWNWDKRPGRDWEKGVVKGGVWAMMKNKCTFLLSWEKKW